MSRERHKQQQYNQTFICSRCGKTVMPPISGGEQRNHCPECLWSLHVDLKSGDRRCGCRGEMEPISVWVKKNEEWAIVHRCIKCGYIRTNRIAGDDNELQLLRLAAKPIVKLPFRAERILEILA